MPEYPLSRGLSFASDFLPQFFEDTAEAIRQRLKDHPEITHEHGARLVDEQEIEWLEGRAKEMRRGIQP